MKQIGTLKYNTTGTEFRVVSVLETRKGLIKVLIYNHFTGSHEVRRVTGLNYEILTLNEGVSNDEIR